MGWVQWRRQAYPLTFSRLMMGVEGRSLAVEMIALLRHGPSMTKSSAMSK